MTTCPLSSDPVSALTHLPDRTDVFSKADVDQVMKWMEVQNSSTIKANPDPLIDAEGVQLRTKANVLSGTMP